MIVLAYVDDLMAFGKKDDVNNLFKEIHERFPWKETGSLNDDGGKVRFLGRNLQRTGDTILLFED